MSLSSSLGHLITTHGTPTFDLLPPEALINWFPGHMAKTSSQIASRLPHCSHIIDLRDARIPLSSANESLDRIISPSLNLSSQAQWTDKSLDFSSQMSSAHHTSTSSSQAHSSGPNATNTPSKLKRIIVFNKRDLADPRITEQWRRYFQTHQQELGMVEPPIWMSLMTSKHQDRGQGGKWSENQRLAFRALLQGLYQHPKDVRLTASSNSFEGNQVNEEELLQSLMEERKPEIQPQIGKSGGLPFRPHVSLVIGLPNVGKSTLINQLTGRKGATVSPRPATTKTFQLFKIDPREEGMRGKGELAGQEEEESEQERSSTSSSSAANRGRRWQNPNQSSSHNRKLKLTPRTVELPPATAFSQPSSTSYVSVSNNWDGTKESALKPNRGMNGSPVSSSRSHTPTLWVMDTPGVMLPSNVDQERGLKLALCGIIADKIVPGTIVTLAKYLHHLLLTLPHAPKASSWLRALHLPLPISLDPLHQLDERASSNSFDSSFDLNDFYSLLNQIGRVYGKHDEYSQAQILVQAFRDGKFGAFSLEAPPSEI